MATLEEALAAGRPEFKAEPYYNCPGDCIVHFLKEVPYTADWVSSWLTFYRCDKTNEVVGYKLSGIGVIMEKYNG